MHNAPFFYDHFFQVVDRWPRLTLNRIPRPYGLRPAYYNLNVNSKLLDNLKDRGCLTMREEESIGLNVVTAAVSTLVKPAEVCKSLGAHRCLGIQEHRYFRVFWKPSRLSYI